VPATATQAGAVLERRVVFAPLAASSIGVQERRIAYWLAGVSLVVLIIGLANAGTLLLVRSAKRRRESAIRAALGAGRGRLLAHLAGESAFVAVVAAGLSMVLAFWLDEAVRRALLPGIVERDVLDPRTLAAPVIAGFAAGLVALAAGAAYLPRGSRHDDFLRPAARSGTVLQRSLLVVQAALSVLLLAGAGMFGRSLSALLDQDFGFTTDGVLLVDFEQGPGSPEVPKNIFTTALDKIGALPAVEKATVYQSMPFGRFHVPPIAVPGRAEPPSVGEQLPFLIAATPQFLAILGIRIIDGRSFTAADERGAPVVIVNETMARGVWPGESAVGKCIRIGFDPDFDPLTSSGPPTPSTAVPCREVVGVARDVRQRSVVPEGIEAGLMQYYVPFSQIPPPPGAVGSAPGIAGVLVKVRTESPDVADSLRRLLAGGRADLPSPRVRRYASTLEDQLRPWQLGTTLLTLFGTLAVVIAAVGLYAAFAHAVVLRKREMAIRIAIGASPPAVRSLILRDAMLLSAGAALAGCLGAVLAGRTLARALYGIVPADPMVLGGAAVLMMAVAAAATIRPARAAALADPASLLKAE
jgi:predicted permease